MYNQRDSDGQKPFLSIDCVLMRQEEVLAMKTLRRLEKFPLHLLGVGNEMIGNFLASAFDAMVPPMRATLFWEILPQNMLSTCNRNN